MTTLATHNGSFHADDVMACAIIRLLSERVHSETVKIVRTRDPEVIANADIVVDVGGVYDPEALRYDHHQPGGAGTRPNGIQYASAGLVWHECATALCSSQKACAWVDEHLISPIDALDNGQGIRQENVLSFSAALSWFNPGWQEANSPYAFDEAFEDAVRFAEDVLLRAVAYANGKAEADQLALSAYLNAEDRSVIVLQQFHPWQDVLTVSQEPLYVVFPDSVSGWRVQCVPTEAGSFESRKPLPEEWLTQKPEGCTFVHRNRFICGAATKETALALAWAALAA